MAKHSIKFVCTNCSYGTPKWIGCCPGCQEWNSFQEESDRSSSFMPQSSKKQGNSAGKSLTLLSLSEVNTQSHTRMLSGISEWDTVIGGGIMPGSLLVLTGDPGIGKSTLLLHIAHKLAANHKVFYFSSEESLEQVKLRAERIGDLNDTLLFSDQARIEDIIETCATQNPAIVIIDSIQNCYFSETHTYPGTIAQLRETSFALMRLAKDKNIALIITCHITKEGHMAGPKTLEHMVDAVFYLQGEDRFNTRILRSVKNRFGPINELGFFSMHEKGLEQMPNINQHLLDETTNAPGSVLISYFEGSRPLILEIQALTIPTKFGIPQRVITGLDHKRVILIAAILEKYLQIKLSAHDIFVKVSGGMKIQDSSSDLGIALALLSSYFQQALPPKTMALGELSLTGAIKPISNSQRYLKEATKFGITSLFVPPQSGNTISSKAIIVKTVYELLKPFS